MATEMAGAERLATAFGSLLRGTGMQISTSRVISFVEALGLVGTADRDRVYWAGRSTLMSDVEDLVSYDSAFAVFWEQRGASGQLQIQRPAAPITVLTDDGGSSDAEQQDETEGPTLQVRYSSTEVLRSLDFAECTDDELEQLHLLMSRIRFQAHVRPSHRLVPSRRASRTPDLRRTVRRAMATGGEPIRLAHKVRDQKPRRLILLVDVSGSMASYARALLRFTHAAVVGRTRVEAFTIGTRLTRITRELQSRDPDAAMVTAGETVKDWSGGTRLGETIREFNDDWGVRGLARGAIVVVLSDGWDRGDPGELGEEMARLHLVTHRLIWVNPLKHTPGFAPLARGMAAALPHVDEFVEGHAFASLEKLVTIISR